MTSAKWDGSSSHSLHHLSMIQELSHLSCSQRGALPLGELQLGEDGDAKPPEFAEHVRRDPTRPPPVLAAWPRDMMPVSSAS